MKKRKTNFIHTHNYFLSIPIIIILLGIFCIPNTGYFAYITEQSIITISNRERAKHNLNQLVPNKKLQLAAKNKAQSIFDSQTFAHNISGKIFSSWIKEQNYNYIFVGENLAIDFVTNQGIVNAWLNSPTHRDNLLNKNFEEIGIAIQEGIFQGEPTTLVVQIFGKPNTSTNPTQNITKNNKLFFNQQKKEKQNIYLVLKNKIKPYNNIFNLNNFKITIFALLTYFLIYLIIYYSKKQIIKIKTKTIL